MDPLCHTLVGAALGEAGLKRRTALAMPTLLIGANLPDIDVAAYAGGGLAALTFRRGWTHGILAVVVLPLVLTGVMLAWARFRRRARAHGPPAVPREILLLAFLAVLSHPVLDFLNVYGVRLLMPFSDRWLYGDILFIADPWLWAILALGIVLGRWWTGPRAAGPSAGATKPPRLALVTVLVYVVGMGASERVARDRVAAELAGAGVAGERLLVSPIPVNPLARDVLVASGDSLVRFRLHWLDDAPPAAERRAWPVGASLPAARAAAAMPDGVRFLHWARFPYYRTEATPAGVRVRIIDARYDASWSSITVFVPSDAPSLGRPDSPASGAEGS